MIEINKNNLSNDLSPYLKQHKENPVNWQIWSKETLDYAKQNKKPIILSIGYASCQWCHVMAHESFEDQETANIMNQLYVNMYNRLLEEHNKKTDVMKELSARIASSGPSFTRFLVTAMETARMPSARKMRFTLFEAVRLIRLENRIAYIETLWGAMAGKQL